MSAPLVAISLVALAAGLARGQGDIAWEVWDPGVEVGLRGLSAVSERVAWATGSDGTWVRTVDGGASWRHGQIAGAEDLGVRDIHAFDAQHALALTIASPGRVYRTQNGGDSWEMVFEDDRAEVFFNCMDFADAERGYAVGDPIDGRFLVIETLDGGDTWELLPASQRPEAVSGEAQFAASGTCLQAEGDRHLDRHRRQCRAPVFRSVGSRASVGNGLHGHRCSKARHPARVFSGCCSGARRDGIVVGGDYTRGGATQRGLPPR